MLLKMNYINIVVILRKVLRISCERCVSALTEMCDHIEVMVPMLYVPSF